MLSDLCLLGVDFRSLPTGIRDLLALTPAGVSMLLRRLHCVPGLEGALVLATCHRLELYGAARTPAVLDACKAALISQTGCPGEVPWFHFWATEAAGHLFRVAAGVQSPILGDTQVSLSLKRAVRLGGQSGPGDLLGRTAAAALRIARRARRETSLAAGAASLGAAVVRTLRHLPPIGGPRPSVLLLGAGAAAHHIAEHLARDSHVELHVAAREPEQALRLAGRYGGRAVRWGNVRAALCTCHAVVAATSASLPELNLRQVETALSLRTTPTLLLIDAGAPRNVEPSAAALPGLHLCSLDDLVRETESDLPVRQAALPAFEAILREETTRWLRGCRHRLVAPALRRLFLAAGDAEPGDQRACRYQLASLAEALRRAVEPSAAPAPHGPSLLLP